MATVNATNIPAVPLDKALYTLVDELMAAEGKQRFFYDWKQEVSTRLNQRRLEFERKRRTGNTEEFRINFRNGPQSMAVIPKTTRSYTARRVNYRKLRETRPDLYSQYVKETPPAVPAKLTFKGHGFGKSAVWDGLRSIGWIEANEHHGEKRAATGRDAELIGQITAWEKAHKDKRTGLRAELLDALVPDLGSLTRVARDDGLIVPSLNPPSKSIELGIAQSHPELNQFVTTYERPEVVTWMVLSERDAWLRLPEDNRDSWAD